ncbi:MAG: glycoside hydrolase family 3 C-terminal domain-containing protein [Pseudomonadota bacterium]
MTQHRALLAPDEAVTAVLAKLSLEEKISLMSGNATWSVGALPEHGIPSLKLCDGPNAARGDAMRGVAAASFPVGAAMGSTWNPELIEALGVALAEEAHTKGVHVLLGPTINLQRHPLGGRNFECYSEDPLLTGALAVAFIRGVQSQGVAACAKHFVANDAEIERHTINSVVDPRSLHELYLQPFEMAVRDADVWTVMSAYNRVNGPYASSHRQLLHDLLKNTWGFDGLVVSDWGAALETVANARAGLDLEMPGPSRTRGSKLLQAIADGEVSETQIDDCARRVLRVIAATAGLFPPGAVPASEPEQAVDLPRHRALARRVAGEAMVLLRNQPLDGKRLLPLAKALRLAVIGPNAEPGQIQGGGSSQVFPHYQVSPVEGLERQFESVRYARGVDNAKYLRVPPVEQCFRPDSDTTGLALKLYPTADRTQAPLVERALSGRVSPWGFLPLGRPGREDSPFSEGAAFAAEVAFDFQPTVSGRHVFGLQSAGLSKLYLDDRLLIDNWSSQTPGDAFFGSGSSEVRAEAMLDQTQRHRVRIAFESTINAFLQGIRYGIEEQLHNPAEALEAAVELAADADACVLVVGSNSDWETEGNDRESMALPGDQDLLVERVLAVNPNTVVVINSGAPMALPWFERVPAVVQAWLPGQEFGNALADVLSGGRNPSGRLAQTFPRRREDAPSDPYFDSVNGTMHYDEALAMGYRGLAHGSIAPLAPFGFGLSYTEFELSALNLVAIRNDGTIELTVDVTNTGAVAGRETVQLYLSDDTGVVSQPPLKLASFAQLDLDAGETNRLSLNVPARAFAYWDAAKDAFVIPSGNFTLRVGHNVADLPLSVSLTQQGRTLGA